MNPGGVAEAGVVVAVMALAAVVHGATGFGFGLVSLALLNFFIDVKSASVLLVVAGLCCTVTTLLRLRRHFRWERVGPVALAALTGAPAGVLFLVRADRGALSVALGVLLIASAVYRLTPRLARRAWHPYWVGLPCGVLSGALSGAFGTGGPPAVAYVASQNFDRFRYAASVQFILSVGASTRIVWLAPTALLSWRLLALSAAGAVAVLVGVPLGLRVLHRFSDRLLATVVAIMLGLLGVKLIALH